MTSQGTNYITYFLIGIIASISMYALADKKNFYRLVFHPASVIHKKEYYRIISSAFVHNDLMHLALNLFMFYVFSSGLEESVPGPGRLGLLIIIGSSLLAGHLLSLIIHRRDIKYNCAGASGIVTGCLFSYMIYHPFGTNLSIPQIQNIPNIYSAVLYLAAMIIYSKRFHGGKVDYSVHVGGGIGGSVTALVMHPAILLNIL